MKNKEPYLLQLVAANKQNQLISNAGFGWTIVFAFVIGVILYSQSNIKTNRILAGCIGIISFGIIRYAYVVKKCHQIRQNPLEICNHLSEIERTDINRIVNSNYMVKISDLLPETNFEYRSDGLPYVNDNRKLAYGMNNALLSLYADLVNHLMASEGSMIISKELNQGTNWFTDLNQKSDIRGHGKNALKEFLERIEQLTGDIEVKIQGSDVVYYGKSAEKTLEEIQALIDETVV